MSMETYQPLSWLKGRIMTAAEHMFVVDGEQNEEHIRGALELFKTSQENPFLIIYSYLHPSIADNAGIGFLAANILEAAKQMKGNTLKGLIFPATVELSSGRKGPSMRLLREIIGEQLQQRGVIPMDIARYADIKRLPEEQQEQAREEANQAKESILDSVMSQRGMIIHPTGGTTSTTYRNHHLIHELMIRNPNDAFVLLPVAFDGTTDIIRYNGKKGKLSRNALAHLMKEAMGMPTLPIAGVFTGEPFVLQPASGLFDSNGRLLYDVVNTTLRSHAEEAYASTLHKR